jgi:hypothetical protein
MSRPKFPRGVILPPAVISAIVDRQRSYDRDPEEYERWDRIKEQQRKEEIMLENERARQEQIDAAEQKRLDDMCGYCQDTGEVDSGGFDPQGHGINIPCECGIGGSVEFPTSEIETNDE